jgi:hypothetical protein
MSTKRNLSITFLVISLILFIILNFHNKQKSLRNRIDSKIELAKIENRYKLLFEYVEDIVTQPDLNIANNKLHMRIHLDDKLAAATKLSDIVLLEVTGPKFYMGIRDNSVDLEFKGRVFSYELGLQTDLYMCTNSNRNSEIKINYGKCHPICNTRNHINIGDYFITYKKKIVVIHGNTYHLAITFSLESSDDAMTAPNRILFGECD